MGIYWAYTLRSKRAQEVADKLIDKFYILEFLRYYSRTVVENLWPQVIKELAKVWKGLIIINVRPRNPKSQGCGDLQFKPGKWGDNNDSWPKGLKFIVHSINTSISVTTGKTLYEIAGAAEANYC